MFSERVFATLQSCGWTPERRVSTESWVSQLTSEGFTFIPKAIAVLENLGGLEIRPLNMVTDALTAGVLRFDPILAASGEFDRVDYWQRQLSTKLSPVAETSRGGMLLLAEDGRVYVTSDGALWLCGESLEDAFENTLIVPKRMAIEIGRIEE